MWQLHGKQPRFEMASTRPFVHQDGYLIVGDYIFSAIFIAELLIKWVALSVPVYFKDKWNW